MTIDAFQFRMIICCCLTLFAVCAVEAFSIRKLERKVEELEEKIEAMVEIRKSFENTIAEIQRKQSNLANVINMQVVGKHAKKEEK